MDLAFKMILDKKNTKNKSLNFLNKNGDDFLCIEESLAKKYLNIRSFLLENNCEFNDNNIIKDKTYIFESPDGGQTIYRREFGYPHDTRELIKK